MWFVFLCLDTLSHCIIMWFVFMCLGRLYYHVICILAFWQTVLCDLYWFCLGRLYYHVISFHVFGQTVLCNLYSCVWADYIMWFVLICLDRLYYVICIDFVWTDCIIMWFVLILFGQTVHPISSSNFCWFVLTDIIIYLLLICLETPHYYLISESKINWKKTTNKKPKKAVSFWRTKMVV